LGFPVGATSVKWFGEAIPPLAVTTSQGELCCRKCRKESLGRDFPPCGLKGPSSFLVEKFLRGPRGVYPQMVACGPLGVHPRKGTQGGLRKWGLFCEKNGF